jgi:hydrophobic/amphiphilic exporter-1 (mainly G- bacteria), HAE1 family
MQKLAELCIKRPIFASMLVLALVVVGAVSYFRLGVDRFPAVDLPSVLVRTQLPGASPEDMESEIEDEVEAAVNTVQGITELRSVSVTGAGVVNATFALGRDIESATEDVRARVQTVLKRLPQGTDPPSITKQDSDSSPIMTVAVSAERSARELTELALRRVKVELERQDGVGEVQLVGGQERAIKVWVDADRLASFGLTLPQVEDAIALQNANMPGGYLTGARSEETLRTMGRLDDPRAFSDLVVSTVKGRPVTLSDIGYTEDGTYEQRSFARLDGAPSVVLDVRRQSGANTVATIQGVKAALARLSHELPTDVRLEVIRDQSRYILTALHEINLHLVLGSLLACLVVLAFMRDLRSTIIAAVAIPTSVITSFGAMWVLGFTLNGVTMLALVLMVGIVIDDAIVVLENIYRFIEEKGLSPFDAAREATREIGLAVLATTLSLVVIFLPVSFMSSISGRFLYQFGITASVAILVSLFVSFTLTPMMSARMLKQKASHGEAASRTGFYAALDRGYARLLALSLSHRRLVLVFALGVVASAVPIAKQVKMEYLPGQVDEAEFELTVNAPQSVSAAAMDELMRSVDHDLAQIPAVRTRLISSGGGFFGSVNSATAYVRIAPHAERVLSLTRLWNALLAGDPAAAFRGNYSQADVMTQVRKRMKRYGGGVRVAVRNAPSFNLGGGPAEIDFAIRGPDLEALAMYGERLRAKADELGGIVDTDSTLKLDKPERRVIIDRARAADLGVRTDDIARTLRIGVGGSDEVSRFRDASTNETYDVQLRLLAKDRSAADALGRLYVPRTGVKGGSGELPMVRLDSVAQFARADAASRIDRLDRQRTTAVRAGVAPGYALADRLEALQKAADELGMPPGYSTRVMGRGRELNQTLRELGWAFGLSVVFMYMILASQFESLLHPLTILLSLPLSVPFALLSLWATGNTLNLYSALGMLVLFGVVKKNAILQVDHMNKLREQGLSRAEAVMRGNRDRLRPILMTTLALVLGMLPLWLGTGPGAEERRAIAVVVIGGQALSLLLTLLVTPVAYTLFDDLRRKASPTHTSATRM